MLVYIDGTALFRNKDGVGEYAKQLISHMVEDNKKDRFVVIGFVDDAKKPRLLERDDLEYKFIALNRRLYTTLFKYIKPMAINSYLDEQPDVVLYPNFVTFPLIKDVPSFTIIHDLVHKDMPEVVTSRNRKYLNRFIPYSIKKSGTQLVATDKFVASTIEEHLSLSAKDIPIVTPAIDDNFKRSTTKEVKNMRKKYKLPPNYVLYVGSLQPRKNIVGILGAYGTLPRPLKVRHPLVLAGSLGWKTEEIEQKIADLRTKNNPVITPGFIVDEDLPALYSGASVFVFPSHYEGFGIPILEAFATKTPVITANKTGTKETAGKAAVLVNPKNPLELSHEIKRLLGSQSTRRTLAKKGTERLKDFSWSKSAKTMLDLMRQATK